MTQGNSNAMVQRGTAQVQSISGSFADPVKLGEVLKRAAKEYHLVAPAPSCGTLPEGCEVSLSSVLIDVAAETYPVAGGGGDDEGGGGGKRGLSKSALDRIASAAGVSWDPHLSRRLDDGSDPHYCLFKSVGHVRQFDGSTATVVAMKEMDMRAGSAQVEALRTRYENKRAKWERNGRRGYEPRPPDNQINEMRLHLVAHAESKARNRCVRSLGVRPSYTPAELAKPFCVARLMFTGRTEDRELARAFALKRADAMLGNMGARALFGPEAPAQSMALAPAVRPPALGVRRELDEDDDLVEDLVPEAPPPPPAPAEPPPRSAAAAQGAPPADASEPAQATGVLTIPGGREKGVSLAKASDEAIDFWARKIAEQIDGGTAKDPARAKAWLEAARAELDGRAAPAGDAAE